MKKVYPKFKEAFKEVTKGLFYQVMLKDGEIERYIDIPPNDVKLNTQSLTLKTTLVPQGIMVPFEIGICTSRKTVLSKFEKIYYFKELDAPFLTNSTSNIKIYYKKDEEQNKIHITGFLINLHGQQILTSMNPKLLFSKSKISDDKDKRIYYGLTGYDMHFCLRSDDDDNLFLEKDAINIRISKVESSYQSHISLNFTDVQSLIVDKIKSVHGLIADILVFDMHGQVFHYASSCLHIQSHPVFNHIYSGQYLSHGFSVEILFQDQDSITRLNSVKCIIPLGKINSWFSTNYKIIDVSYALAATPPVINTLSLKNKTPEFKDDYK
eukprot:TRINITY_DN15261_c0_g1_i1.p1 TRINITY_DN15261_c0_g1~~TRINITY_DN15261_c0_g1_i1.p1  ORF type:complete len:324 (+),score=63.00 TRINITY_DN15261_c0_g1_i1:21-992(+)